MHFLVAIFRVNNLIMFLFFPDCSMRPRKPKTLKDIFKNKLGGPWVNWTAIPSEKGHMLFREFQVRISKVGWS